MGCGGSTKTSTTRNESRKLSLFGGNPVVMEIGEKVAMKRNPGPVLIVVFGGPGSKKGKLLNDLSQIFGLEILNAESIMLENVRDELETDEPCTLSNVYKHVKANPELLRLDTCLKKITKKLDDLDKNKCYLLDLIPNTKMVLSSNLFIKDCNNELKYFETKYPLSCAISLAMPVDKIIRKYQTQCAKKDTAPTPTPAKQENGENKGGQPAAGGGGQSDEVSFVRTKMRVTHFADAIKSFVDYFKFSERLVYLDIYDKDSDDILSNLCDFFVEHNFSVLGNSRTLLLFTFGNNDLDVDIFLNGATMGVQNVELEEFCSVDQKPEEVVATLCKQMDVINQYNPGSTAFVVNTGGTPLTKTCLNESSEKEVMFQDSDDAQVDRFLPITISNTKGAVAQAVVLNTMVMLFSKDVPIKLCRWVALKVKYSKNTSVKKDSTIEQEA